MCQVGAERLGHPDGLPVVLFDRRGRAPDEPRGVLRRPSRRCRRSCPRPAPRRVARGREWLAVLPGDEPGDAPVGLHDQRRNVDVVHRSHAQRRGRVDERLHQHVAAALLAGPLVGICGTWPRGAGFAMVLNGNAFSPPVNISPSSHGGSQPGSPQNSGLNGTPHSHQPVEVVDAAVAVVAQLFLVGARPDRHVAGTRTCCRRCPRNRTPSAALCRRRGR